MLNHQAATTENTEQLKAMIVNTIISLLAEMNGGVAPDIEIDSAASLSQVYGISSVSMISMIMMLESEADVVFEEHELVFENFSSVDAILALLLEKLA